MERFGEKGRASGAATGQRGPTRVTGGPVPGNGGLCREDFQQVCDVRWEQLRQILEPSGPRQTSQNVLFLHTASHRSSGAHLVPIFGLVFPEKKFQVQGQEPWPG